MRIENLWVAFDCETTGFPPTGRLIEISAILFTNRGRVLDEFHSLVAPPVGVPAFITEITGISSDMLVGAEPASVVLRRFVSWLNPTALLIAHNATFDIRILAGELPTIVGEVSNSVVDSLPIARTLGIFQNNRLETIGNCLCPELSGYHRSAVDSQIVKHLLLHALECQIDVVHPNLFRGKSLPAILNW